MGLSRMFINLNLASLKFSTCSATLHSASVIIFSTSLAICFISCLVSLGKFHPAKLACCSSNSMLFSIYLPTLLIKTKMMQAAINRLHCVAITQIILIYKQTKCIQAYTQTHTYTQHTQRHVCTVHYS